MAEAAVTASEPPELECAVCHEEFTEPKILPCTHRVCRTCLLTWLHTQDTNTGDIRAPLNLEVRTSEQASKPSNKPTNE